MKHWKKALGKIAIKELLPLQPGDLSDTYADVEDLVINVGYQPTTSITEGIHKFVAWYLAYYNHTKLQPH